MNHAHAIVIARRRLSLAVLLVVWVSAGLLVSVGQAFAHASLVRAEPADGAVIEKAPPSFLLTFNEPASPIVLTLTRPDRTAVVLDRFVLRDRTLDIAAPADLGNGTYVLSWRVISEDGHPVGGSAVFSIGAPSAGPVPVVDETVDWAVRTATWAVRVAIYGGLFLGVGGVFFISWVGGRTRTASSVALWAIAVSLIVMPLSVGLQGLDAVGASLDGLARATTWKAGFSNAYGVTAIIIPVALVTGAIATVAGTASGRFLSLLGLIATGLALAAGGHASTAHPQWLTRPAVFLHGAGIAFWAGSLIPLRAALAARSPDAIITLRRFSTIIPFAVLPLVVAGILLAVIQVQSLAALWTMAYGRVLLIKLALLGVLFLLAAINRFRLTEPALTGDHPATLRLRQSIRVEIALVLAVFAIAALWRFTPPPRALAETAAMPAFVHIHTDKAMAEVTITPGRAGPVAVSITTMTGDFGPLDAREITLVLSNAAAGIEQITRPAAKAADGTWHVDDLNLPFPGRWTVRVDILISDFELARIEDQIEIRP